MPNLLYKYHFKGISSISLNSFDHSFFWICRALIKIYALFYALYVKFYILNNEWSEYLELRFLYFEIADPFINVLWMYSFIIVFYFFESVPYFNLNSHFSILIVFLKCLFTGILQFLNLIFVRLVHIFIILRRVKFDHFKILSANRTSKFI